MVRRKKPSEVSGSGLEWMVTFTDMMTLLLAFFVLLLSMSSMDRSVLRDAMSHLVGEIGLAPKKGAGKVPARFEFVEQYLENPEKVLHNPQRLKDVLFPDEVLPQGMSRSTLDRNLQVLVRPEGVALVLSDSLLFTTGQSELSADSKKLLSEFAFFLASVPVPVNIAGYTDNVPGTAQDNLTLSENRAVAVLSHFLEFGFDSARFSISAYGEAFPLADNATPEGQAKNRRVEILLKTSGRTYL